MTIQPQAKLPIDMAALLQSLGADATGDFAEGSVSLNFVGTIMPLVGQMTITNPALGLVHEAEMVENDPGRTDIPAMLNGVWWNIAGGRDAQIMVTNVSSLSASADVFLDYGGARHPSAALTFNPHETKTVSIIQLLAALNASPSQVPEGGIMIIQRESQPTLIAQGKVLDPASGFSTTLSFPDPARERSNSLHASGVPIGAPTQDSPFANTGYFVPHVVVRNLTGAPQAVTVTVEYPKGSTWNSAGAPGGSAIPTAHAVAPVSPPATDKTNQNGGGDTVATISPADITDQITLAPVSLEPYSTLDYSLDSIVGQLPSAVPYCSIRIQYSGAPGSALAQVSSVETKSDMVVDAAVANEGDGWRGSGANPWHLDGETESIVFLTDASDKPARIGFSVTAGGVHYYLTTLKLAAHETRAVDLRKLRDAQQPDFKGNLIPAGATDGSVTWNRIDNVTVSGRLVVIQRHKSIASSYDCCTCPCPSSESYYSFDSNVTVSPGSSSILAGDSIQMHATGEYYDCNYIYYYFDVTNGATWSSNNTSVATVNYSGQVTGVSGGTAAVTAQWSDCSDWEQDIYGNCDCRGNNTGRGSASLTVLAPYPTGFVQSGSSGGGGVLVFTYQWGSSSGNTNDLHNCKLGEFVTYPGYQQGQQLEFLWPLPAWNYVTSPNPTVNIAIAGNNNDCNTWTPCIQDEVKHSVFVSSPASTTPFTAYQKYQYICPGVSNGAAVDLLTGITIGRSVTCSGPTCTYTATKSGASSSCTVGTGYNCNSD